MSRGQLAVVTVGVLFGVMLGAPPAWAGEAPPTGGGGDGQCGPTVDLCRDGKWSGEDGSGGSEGGGGSAAVTGPPVYRWYAPAVAAAPDGSPCWTVRVEQVSEDPPPPGKSYGEVLALVASFDRNGTLYDLCPQLVEDVAGAEAVERWVGTNLPLTTGNVPPGWMVPGLRAYLVLEAGSAPVLPVVDTPLGPMTIVVDEPEFVVDWGDGSAPTVTTDRGVAWPGGPGEITHVYSWAGEVTVTVTTVWRARFDLGSASAALEERRQQTRLLLPVREVQSVRQR